MEKKITFETEKHYTKSYIYHVDKSMHLDKD